MATPRKAPQDHKAPADSTPFVFDGSTGSVTLPRFSEIPFGVMRKMRNEDETEIAFYLFESLLSEDDLAVLDTYTQAEVGELMEAWQADSGISAPESSAS